MRELSNIECEEVSGGAGLWAKVIAIYDAVTDGIEGFVDGAKAGYGFEEAK